MTEPTAMVARPGRHNSSQCGTLPTAVSTPGRVPAVLLVDLARFRGGVEKRVAQLCARLITLDVPVKVACLAGSALEGQLARLALPRVALRREKASSLLAATPCRLFRSHPGWAIDARNTQSLLTPTVSTRVGSIGSIFTLGRSAMLLDEPEADQLGGTLRFAAGHPAEMAHMAGQARLDAFSSLSLHAMVARALGDAGRSSPLALEAAA